MTLLMAPPPWTKMPARKPPSRGSGACCSTWWLRLPLCWQQPPSPRPEESKCPFERVSGLNEFEEYDDKIDIPDEMMSKPFIIEGLMESWPAMQNDRWQRYKLLKSYGKKSVASKTQTGIRFATC